MQLDVENALRFKLTSSGYDQVIQELGGFGIRNRTEDFGLNNINVDMSPEKEQVFNDVVSKQSGVDTAFSYIKRFFGL